MTFGASSRRARALSVALAVAFVSWSAEAWASGLGRNRVQAVAPMYAQVPVMSYAPQVPVMSYVAQVPAMSYGAQAPVVPYVQQAPAAGAVQQAPAAGAASYGSRIRMTDRNDLIEDLRKENRDSLAGGDSTKRERRSTLRDSARTQYAEAIGTDSADLNDYENQDVELIVSSILDHETAGQAPAAAGYYPAAHAYPAATGHAPAYAPAFTAARPVMIVQPMVPVQLLVPVQPRHRLFGR